MRCEYSTSTVTIASNLKRVFGPVWHWKVTVHNAKGQLIDTWSGLEINERRAYDKLCNAVQIMDYLYV